MSWYSEVFDIAFADIDKANAGKKWEEQLKQAEEVRIKKERERKLEDKKLGLLD